QKADAFHVSWIPILYSIAMAVSGAGSLVFGKLFDRVGIGVLVPLTIVSALFAPLGFFGGFCAGGKGAAIWGLGVGGDGAVVQAGVADMVPVERRPSAFGMFTAGYGIAWFVGSAVMGLLYDHSITAVVVFCVVLQLMAVPVLLKVRTMMGSRIS